MVGRFIKLERVINNCLPGRPGREGEMITIPCSLEQENNHDEILTMFSPNAADLCTACHGVLVTETRDEWFVWDLGRPVASSKQEC